MKTINLIPKTIDTAPEYAELFVVLRKISYGLLLLFIVSGILVGSVYAYVTSQLSTLAAKKKDLTVTVQYYRVKEGLLQTAKQRIASIDKIVATQKQISGLFPLIDTIVTSGQLSSMTMEDTGKVLLSMHVNTIPEAIGIVDSLLARTQAGTVLKPSLVSFSIGKEGGFELSVSFVPKLGAI